MTATRTESDSFGSMDFPDGLWGIHTQRAMQNFEFGNLRVSRRLIAGMAKVKKAAVSANAELGYLDLEIARYLSVACDEVIAGQWHDQLELNALQGGAGTSTHMNLNEVLANRALELMGHPRARYDIIHPLHQVNCHQSTNDVFPTALKIAAIEALRELSQSVAELQGACQRAEKRFASVIKMGYTEWQPAVPMTLGAEFAAFAQAFERDRWRTFKAEERLRCVNLGGTAVGTGLAASRSYIFLVIEKLREITGLGLARAESLTDATANSDSFVEVAGMLEAHASSLIKINEDWRRLAALGQIRLSPMQTGSSIMPGKVNPVLCEAAIQCGLKVIANCGLITQCASRATFQINEFIPLLAHALLESFDLLIPLNRKLTILVDGMSADPKRCEASVFDSVGVLTAFVPMVGYARAEKWARQFLSSSETDLKAFLIEKVGEDAVKEVLSPEKLNALGYVDVVRT